MSPTHGSFDLADHGDDMQVMRHRDVRYVGHFGPSGMGASILDIFDLSFPRLARQIAAPGGAGPGSGPLQLSEDEPTSRPDRRLTA